VCGRLVLRLADAEILPFDFRGASQTYARYVGEVTKLADDLRRETEQTNQLISEGHLKLAADPALPFVSPGPKEPVPYLNFAPLQNAAQELKVEADSYHEMLRAYAGRSQQLNESNLRSLNKTLFQSERTLLNPKGLPRQPWYRHQIYAPGFYTGYGVKTLPGVREAIEERKWTEASDEIQNSAAALRRYAASIRSARTLLNSAADSAVKSRAEE